MTAQVYNPTTGGFTLLNMCDKVCITNTAKVMVNGDTVFNVTGDIFVKAIISECESANDTTASTLQWSTTTALAATQTFTNASATLASLAAGATIQTISLSGLTTIPSVSANGVVALLQGTMGVRIPPGVIKYVIGVGSTTGKWRHYLIYGQLEPGAVVTPAF